MRSRPVRWLALLLVTVSTPLIAADRPWRMATTPHYRLISQLDDRKTTAWMRGFDQFILSTSDILRMDLRTLPPLTVVIFESQDDYAPYKLALPNGQVANVAGQFVRRPTWSMIGMAHISNHAELRRTIHHEATHWIMSVDQSRHPAWFSEGIAEMFSTFERRGDQVNWAKPIDDHLLLLNYIGEQPLAQFLAEPSAIFARDDRTGRFYAQAWAFTHFLMMSKDPNRRQLLFKFLQTFRTQSGEATVKAVFGESLPQIQSEFKRYADQRSFSYMVQPAKPAPEPPPLQPAPAAFVESSLGLLAMGAGRAELAKQHADKAIALDANNPDAQGVLAYLALDKDDFDRAATHAEAALQRGSKDSDLFMLLGDSYASGANSKQPNAKQARVNMYENAINLNPRRLGVYHRLIDALFEIEKPREEDAKFLAVGLKVFPGEDWLRVGTAVVEHRLGRRDPAMATLENTLRTDSTLDNSQREYATNVRRGWLVDALNDEIQAAVTQRDFTRARAVIGRYRERLGTEPQVTAFLQEADGRMEVGELMIQLEAAQQAKKKAETRTLVERLLKHPHLPAEMRSHLEQLAGA